MKTARVNKMMGACRWERGGGADQRETVCMWIADWGINKSQLC